MAPSSPRCWPCACRRECPRGSAGCRAAGLCAPASRVLVSFPAVRYLLPTVVAVGLFATPYVPLMPSIVAALLRRPVLHRRPAHERGRRSARSPTSTYLAAAAGLRPSAAPGDRRAARRRAIILAAFAWSRCFALSLPAASGARRLPSSSPSTPPTPCCSSRCPTTGAVASSASTACRLPAPRRSAACVTGWLADHIGLTATLTLNGLLIVAAGLLGRWRLHNHPEALRGLMKSLAR